MRTWRVRYHQVKPRFAFEDLENILLEMPLRVTARTRLYVATECFKSAFTKRLTHRLLFLAGHYYSYLFHGYLR